MRFGCDCGGLGFSTGCGLRSGKGSTVEATCNGETLDHKMKLPDTGPIGLEADRGVMEYRKIRLKELK